MDCPLNSPERGTLCRLYHKLVTLPPDSKATLTEFQKAKRVLVELEDTPPSTLMELKEEARQNLTQEVGVNEAERLDMDRLKHPMTRILDLSRSGPLELPPGVSNLNPFSVFTYPRGITASGAVELKPLTQGRMGFALCFSLVDLRTLEEAMEIHYLLTLLKEKKRDLLTPLLFLIGTKEDVLGQAETIEVAKDTQALAEDFSSRHHIPFFKVSSKSGRNVDRCLDEMVAQIVQTPSLSAMDIAGATQDELDELDDEGSGDDDDDDDDE